MTSTAAFIARLLGVLAAAVATLAVAVGILGLPTVQAGGPGSSMQDGSDPVSKH